MKTVRRFSGTLFLLSMVMGLGQATPEVEEEYYIQSQELSLLLMNNPQKMDSILGEIDKLDALLKEPNEIKKKTTEKITRIVLQYRSGMCEGYCNIKIDVWSAAKKVTRLPGTVDGRRTDLPMKKETIRLNKEDWKQILASFSWKEIKALPDTIGCPGCDDGAVATLTVSTVDSSHKITFEGPDSPKPIRALTSLLTADVFKK